MSDNGNIQSQTVELVPEEKSILVVQFEGSGKAAFRASLNNVSPAQMSSLLVWLQWYIQHTFDAAEAVQAASKIAVP